MLVVLLLVLGVLVVVAVVLVVVLVVVPPLNQYLVLPRGRFGEFVNVNPFTNASLGSLCGVPHVGVQGRHFCKETSFKSRTFRACMFFGDLRSAGEPGRFPILTHTQKTINEITVAL